MDFVKIFKNRKYQFKYLIDKKKVNGQFLIQLTQKVFNNYCDNLKSEEFDTYDLVQRKLTRNILLAEQSEYHPDNFIYGNLVLYLNHEHTRVIYVNNRKGYFTYDVDKQYKEWLNNKLGINDLENQRKEKVS